MSTSEACNARLRNALQLPITSRCYEIQYIGEDYSSKELHNVFPLLVEDIFGITNQVGWGLRRTFRNYQDPDFHQLFEFLKPQGYFFKMCYKLVSDVYFRYDFPLNYLPRKVRDMIEDGMVPAFYMDKLKVDHQTRVPTALSLNSFEYFMFHFAYHLVNPWIQRDEGIRDLWDTAYLQLAEEYVKNFLPCDGSPVQPLAGYFMAKTSLPLQSSNRPMKSPTLFRQSVLLTQSSTSSSFHSSPTSTQQNTHVEVWRSEVISQVFIDFWLSFDEKDVSRLNTLSAPERVFYSPSSFSTPKQSTLDSSQQDPQRKTPLSMFHYPRLPSMEHMRIVRNLLKHIHYFANSYGGGGTAMDELKRIILPSSQGKIYAFLRRTIDQWPLDSSFRLVLETWLSYIQPWRYTNYSAATAGQTRDSDSQVTYVDRRWLGFIAENLLAYTVILKQVLRRCSRLDLVTPKNAVMLFRTTKVFSQPGLNVLLTEAESCLDDSVSTPTLPHKWSAIVRQQVIELEGPAYLYTFMFGKQAKTEMLPFCQFVYQAYCTAYSLQKTEEFERKTYPTSFLTSLVNFFTPSYAQMGDYSLEDRIKVTSYLELSLQNLCSIFSIENFNMSPPECSLPSPSSSSSLVAPSFNESFNTSFERSSFRQVGGCVGTPREAKFRARHIQYEGDPDLQPIKSTENAFLVRLFHQISAKLNEMYSVDMSLAFYREDLYGRMARQILCAPTLTRNYDKRFPGRHSPRLEVCLPPRLSLRSLASHRTITYYVVSCVLAYMWGYGPIAFTTILLGVWALFVVVKAFSMPWLQARRPDIDTRQTFETLHDDSFVSSS